MQSNKRFGRIQGFLPINNSAQPGIGLAQPGSGVAENTNFQKQSSFRGSNYLTRGGGSGAQFGVGGFSRDIGGGDSAIFVGGQPGGVLSISKPGNGFGPNNNTLEQSSTRGTGSMARGGSSARGGGSAQRVGGQTGGYALHAPLVDDTDIIPDWSDREEAVPVPLQERRLISRSADVNGSKLIQGVNDAGQGKDIGLGTTPKMLTLEMPIVQKQPKIESGVKPKRFGRIKGFDGFPASVSDVGKADIAPETSSNVLASSVEVPVANQPAEKKPHRFGRIAGFDGVPPTNLSSGSPAAIDDKHEMDTNVSLQHVVRGSNDVAENGGNYSPGHLQNLLSDNAQLNPVQSVKGDVGVLASPAFRHPVGYGAPENHILMSKEDYRNLRSLSLELLNAYTKFSAALLKFD